MPKLEGFRLPDDILACIANRVAAGEGNKTDVVIAALRRGFGLDNPETKPDLQTQVESLSSKLEELSEIVKQHSTLLNKFVEQNSTVSDSNIEHSSTTFNTVIKQDLTALDNAVESDLTTLNNSELLVKQESQNVQPAEHINVQQIVEQNEWLTPKQAYEILGGNPDDPLSKVKSVDGSRMIGFQSFRKLRTPMDFEAFGFECQIEKHGNHTKVMLRRLVEGRSPGTIEHGDEH
ncbi:hypothetical protein [Iningainema tapete]|uniref:Uncharacterized protein n=1 Tax=Iningainema tapete BLCC-T55 TaxID=2748662 RepID=A0A8J6XIE9_9CYAN|nr:hypothetical protein [Iningainema tapete]MBD2773337.1 hypothetical protein [Iningainema tapete BLCC-T55]